MAARVCTYMYGKLAICIYPFSDIETGNGQERTLHYHEPVLLVLLECAGTRAPNFISARTVKETVLLQTAPLELDGFWGDTSRAAYLGILP